MAKISPAMKCGHMALVAALIVTPAGIHAQEAPSFKEILESAPGERAFIYKLVACLSLDTGLTQSERKKGKGKEGSYMLTESQVKDLAKGLSARYNIYGASFKAVWTSTPMRKFGQRLFTGGKYSWDEGIEVCKKTFAALMTGNEPIKGDPASEESSDAREKIASEAHDKCLEARDYEGCLRANTSAGSSKDTEDHCIRDTCFIKTRGADIYGLPKPPIGWLYRKIDNGTIFYFSQMYRIPHKGQDSRYIAVKRITRLYQSPESGSSGSLIGGGSLSTNCTDYGLSMSCTTSGGAPTYIPGRSAKPGGVVSGEYVSVFDCEDKTYALYKDARLWMGWEKGRTDYFPELLRGACKQGHGYIKNLPALPIKI